MSEHSAQAPVFSQRLGAIAPQQFQAALTRFGLGTFVAAAPVSQGLFGQNVFVQSTQGDYVLRGNPHYAWQFPKERFGATLLHERTSVPVAHPYLLDASADIFGWPYLLMPRLRGSSPADPSFSPPEQLEIARAMGENLVRMQHLTWPVAGAYDLASDQIQPFEAGFAAWIDADLRRWLDAARAHGATTADDCAWVEQMLDATRAAVERPFLPCFVMNDYAPGNVLVEHQDGRWQVSGLFDLMEYYFGDGEADLVRLIALYLDRGQPHGVALAQAFAGAYLAGQPAREGIAERYALYMLRDRLIVWEYGTRPGNSWFAPDQSLRGYAQPYIESWRLVLPESVR